MPCELDYFFLRPSQNPAPAPSRERSDVFSLVLTPRTSGDVGVRALHCVSLLCRLRAAAVGWGLYCPIYIIYKIAQAQESHSEKAGTWRDHLIQTIHFAGVKPRPREGK